MDKKIALIDYKDELAKDVATMWANSVSGWNGESKDCTEQSIIDSETNSSHLQLKLAQVDNLIAGYCKLSVDHQDTGALYIDLLNVRDDFHGKKVGKALVKNAVEKTIELKWPRVDLHTWEGNLKAIPLYKKCGYFWEKRENTTHLINLIPTVVQTPLLEEYFKKADWYNDSTREITVQHDVNDVNGFNVWTYSWEKDGVVLEVDFTRRGRGIRRIENNDFSITTNIHNYELVFGDNYQIEYEIVNKSGKELNIELRGVDDNNITYNYSKTINVTDKSVFTGQFQVNPISNKQMEWKTHPGVVTEIKVNGKTATFKTGVQPQFPLSLELKHNNYESKITYPGQESEVFIDIENNFKSDANFKFELPSNDRIAFLNSNISVELKPGEKKSIPVKYTSFSNCFYNPEVTIVGESNGKEVVYKSQLNETFRTGFGSYYGESNSFLEIGIGNYSLNINKDYNYLHTFHDATKFDCDLKFIPPKLGKPFNSEFEHKSYDSYEVEEGNGWIQLNLQYSSDSYNNIIITRSFKLYQNGFLDRWAKITNNSSVTSKELYISDVSWKDTDPMFFSYKDKIMSLEEDNTYFIDDWDTNEFTENWIVFRGKKFNKGITWDSSYTLNGLGWCIGLNCDIGKIPPNGSFTTGVVTLGCDNFTDMHKFRELALKRKVCKKYLTPGLDFSINNGNPFCTNDVTFSSISHSAFKYEAIAELDVLSNGEILNKEFVDGKRVDFNCSLKMGVHKPTLRFIQEEYIKTIQKALFSLSDERVELNKKDYILSADNGVLKISSSCDYAPSILSMEYNGDEILDSSYPEKVQKAWWNPWSGGIMSFPEHMESLNCLLSEDVVTEFIEKVDSKGNRWSGIKITLDIKENLEYKGLVYSQYYLLLPGVPVLAQFCEFTQNGVFNPRFDFQCNCFFKGRTSNKDLYVNYINYTDVPTTIRSGIEAVGVTVKRDLKLTDSSRNHDINFFCEEEDYKGFYFNPEVSMIWFNNTSSAKSGETGRTKPNFIIVGQKGLNDEILTDLNNIRF